MSTPDKCPHCGERVGRWDESLGLKHFICGSVLDCKFGSLNQQSNYCAERASHAETRKQLIREHEKWGKLKFWVLTHSSFICDSMIREEMNRLDAEAKEGQ